MWALLMTLRTVIYYGFHGSVKTGQFIVTSAHFVLTKISSVVQKLFFVLTVVIEDFAIFLKDLGHHLTSAFLGILNFFDWIVSTLSGFYQAIANGLQAAYTSTHSVFFLGVVALTNILNGIKNVFICVKQTIVMFGDGVWFIVVFLPKSVINLIKCVLELCVQFLGTLYNSVIKSSLLIIESLYDCYYFLTDMPLEALMGILIAACIVYVFVQFYLVLYTYFKNVIISFLQGVNLKFHFLKQGLKRIFLWFSTSKSYVNQREDSKIDAELCVICQDNQKCVLVLPCKHLCLCTNCTPRLLRYSGRCPICRKHINSTIKIYL